MSHLEKTPLVKQLSMSKQYDPSLERASHTVSTRKNQLNTEEESTIVSGVAQIANIGSIISSTFAVFNDKFARFDSILVENTRLSDEMSGDSRAHRQKISHVIKSMNAMQDQINAIAASVHRIEIQIGAPSKESDHVRAPITVTGSEKDEDILKERELMLAKELLAEEKSEVLKQERDKLWGRITDLEKEMHGAKLKSADLDIDSSEAFSAPRDIFVVSAELTEQKEELLRIVSSLDEKIDEREEAPQNFRIAPPALDIPVKLEEEFLTNAEEKHQVNVRCNSNERTLSKLDLFEKYELSADSQEMSGRWESFQPTQSTHESADTPLEPLLPGNDNISASIAANSEAIEVMMGIVNQLREEAVLDRVLAAKNKEAFSQRLAEMECAAELNSGTFLAKLRDVSERLIDYQEGSQSAPGSSLAVKRLQVALNDVIAEVDDLKYKGTVQNGDSSSVDQLIGGRQQGSQDHLNTASLLLQIEITSVKNKLLGLRDDLDNGLDSYADAHATDPEGSEAFESPFIARVAEFADRLDNVILTFYSKETPEATLIALFHPLDALTIELEALFELDQQSVASMGITFDDVTADDNGRSVRDTMRLVWEASLPLLDHRVNKITMRRRLTALEAAVRSKADATVVSSLEAELRYMIAAKADQKELLSIMSKKVSIGELQRLKDQLMKQIVSIRGFEYSQAGTLNTREEGISDGGLTSAEGLEMSSELKQLGRRFDILHSFHEDLVTQCTGYVPREEVEQALRALLGELKIMKGNSITADLLGESLKTKANASEVQKLVSALTGALGDIGARNDFASAIYARCLVCDKPVKSLVSSMLAPLSNNRNTRAFSPDRGSANQSSANASFFFDKNSDRGLGPFDRPSSMGLLNGSVGSGSMGFAAWGSSQSSPLSLNSHTLPYGTALTTHSGIIQGRSRANSAYDTVTLNQTSIDLPPLQIQCLQGPGKGKSNIQPGNGRVRGQRATGPSPALDTR